jgi:hypothetical protein
MRTAKNSFDIFSKSSTTYGMFYCRMKRIKCLDSLLHYKTIGIDIHPAFSLCLSNTKRRPCGRQHTHSGPRGTRHSCWHYLTSAHTEILSLGKDKCANKYYIKNTASDLKEVGAE